MNKYKFGLLIITVFIFFISCKQRELSAEEKGKVEELRIELQMTNEEISTAELENEKYTGGLIKNLIQVRLEILKTNRALIQQRIHAIESGSPVKTETRIYKPDSERLENIQEEIKKQRQELEGAKKEASKYSGGLAQAMANTTVVTIEQSLAMLQQQYLMAKYGLVVPQGGDTTNSKLAEAQEESQVAESKDISNFSPKEKSQIENEIINVEIISKELTKADYQEFVFFKLNVSAPGLEKNARAIKGIMNFQDLFGETMMKINWTIDEPISAGGDIILEGGFKYNQFLNDNRWVAATDKNNMKAVYTVRSILYEDGTKVNF